MNEKQIIFYVSGTMMKSRCVLAVFFLFLYTGLLQGNEQKTKVFILAYHTFFGKTEYTTDISRKKLMNHLDRLLADGYTFISFTDFKNQKITGTKNIIITIDDGNVSAYKAYHTVFKPRNIKPLFAIYPAVINKVSQAMTWDMVRELSTEGCEIASHGYHHLYVDYNLYRKNQYLFRKEIYSSKELLEKNINRTVDTFVYPYGVHSAVTITELKKAGYNWGLLLKWRPVYIPVEHDTLKYKLPRYMYNSNWETLYRSIRQAK